jgi:hypothetical protein
MSDTDEILALREKLNEACGLLAAVVRSPTGKVSPEGERQQLAVKERVEAFLHRVGYREWENIHGHDWREV